jgi:tRNA(Ile)-lysidine synthase
MALRLRQDESCLTQMSQIPEMDVEILRKMHPALRNRALENFLKRSGVREPEASHIAQAESLVFSQKPSTFARFPGGVVIARNYNLLTVQMDEKPPEAVELSIPGSVLWGDYRITATEDGEGASLYPQGPVIVRSRQSGDAIRLSGGTKTLKKLFIDRKIPASERCRIPVISDSRGILAVHGIGINLDLEDRNLAPVRITIEKITNTEEKENA